MIKKLRKASGMSQEELGAAVGVTRQTIDHWENGPAVSPKYVHVMRAADALDARESDLLAAIATDHGGVVKPLVPRQNWRALVDAYLQTQLGRGATPRVREHLYRTQDRERLYQAIHGMRSDFESRSRGRR